MRIYDEENVAYDDSDDEMQGFEMIDSHSIFAGVAREKEELETIASPIPQNEQTVILAEPNVARLKDGDELTLEFSGEDCCDVKNGAKKVGSLKPAYVHKLKTERGSQLAKVYYKAAVPAMIRIVFGEGNEIPTL